MDWTVLGGVAVALLGAGGLGSLVGNILSRRSAHEDVVVKGDHVTVERQQADTDQLTNAVTAWESLIAPLRVELGELRARLAVTEDQHRECLALTAALTRELLQYRQIARGRRHGD